MAAQVARQTISYLTRRLADAGIRPGARHGQHFLIDQNLLRLIVDRAQVENRDVVLEVGTGTGALLLNATKVSEVQAVATAGERMPHKSTYFYPKPLTGLVINVMEG